VSPRRVRRLVEHLEAYAFLLPATAILAVFHFIPIAYAFYVSLLQWNLIDPVHPYVGAANYAALLGDQKFLTALANTTYRWACRLRWRSRCC
jgi:ABC-type sugar transport system permease subunit